MHPRPDITTLCCVNPECKLYGLKNQANLRIRKEYGRDRIRYLRCCACAEEFSERRNTALFNSKIPEERAVSVIEHYDYGNSLEATAKLTRVSKDTASRLLRRTGRICQKLHDTLVQGVESACLQFDEKWSYVGKKQKRLTSDDPSEFGDRWDLNAIDAQTKLLVSVLMGKRTAENIHALVQDAASRLSSRTPRPAIFTDGESGYIEAIRQAFGRRYSVPRQGVRGPQPKPIFRIPYDLVYAQVIKHRKGSRIEKVEVRPIFGKGKLAGVLARLGWNQANTSAIERFNLTDRCRNSRKVRRTLSFSKQVRFHDWMGYLSAVTYNFCHTHRSLKLPLATREYLHRTPAMAAGLASVRWQTIDVLRYVALSWDNLR